MYKRGGFKMFKALLYVRQEDFNFNNFLIKKTSNSSVCSSLKLIFIFSLAVLKNNFLFCSKKGGERGGGSGWICIHSISKTNPFVLFTS